MRRVYIVKTRKKYLLLLILLLMHVASTSTSDDNDAAMRRWAPCSPLDDIAYRRFRRRGDAPNDIFDEGWRGGEGGRGLRTSNVVTTHGGDRDSGVVATQRLFFVSARTSVKKHGHHMILRWCPTNLGSLYTMVPSDWHGNHAV